MNWNQRIRQAHRWIAVAFTVTVIANIAVMSGSAGTPPEWVTYSPLLPLALLQFSGLYMLVQPWIAQRRSARGAG
jgi:hypothetical protein